MDWWPSPLGSLIPTHPGSMFFVHQPWLQQLQGWLPGAATQRDRMVPSESWFRNPKHPLLGGSSHRSSNWLVTGVSSPTEKYRISQQPEWSFLVERLILVFCCTVNWKPFQPRLGIPLEQYRWPQNFQEFDCRCLPGKDRKTAFRRGLLRCHQSFWLGCYSWLILLVIYWSYIGIQLWLKHVSTSPPQKWQRPINWLKHGNPAALRQNSWGVQIFDISDISGENECQWFIP